MPEQDSDHFGLITVCILVYTHMMSWNFSFLDVYL